MAVTRRSGRRSATTSVARKRLQRAPSREFFLAEQTHRGGQVEAEDVTGDDEPTAETWEPEEPVAEAAAPTEPTTARGHDASVRLQTDQKSTKKH